VWAVGRSSPVMVTSYVSLQPLIGALLAFFMLGERMGLKELLGFVLIMGGLYVVSRANLAEQHSGR